MAIVNMDKSRVDADYTRTHLRIVIPSANLVPYDWGETGVMENVSFLMLDELPIY